MSVWWGSLIHSILYGICTPRFSISNSPWLVHKTHSRLAPTFCSLNATFIFTSHAITVCAATQCQDDFHFFMQVLRSEYLYMRMLNDLLTFPVSGWQNVALSSLGSVCQATSENTQNVGCEKALDGLTHINSRWATNNVGADVLFYVCYFTLTGESLSKCLMWMVSTISQLKCAHVFYPFCCVYLMGSYCINVISLSVFNNPVSQVFSPGGEHP